MKRFLHNWLFISLLVLSLALVGAVIGFGIWAIRNCIQSFELQVALILAWAFIWIAAATSGLCITASKSDDQ